MKLFAYSLFFLSASAFFADAYAVLNNDFTRANTTFTNRRYRDSKTSDMNDRRFRDSGKMLEQKQYENIGDVSYLRERKPRFEEGLPAEDMAKRRARGDGEMFGGIPEYAGKTKDDMWSGANVPLGIKNADRDLTKVYEGKIDVNRRATDYQELLNDYYSDVMEMSMREINKYYFRESHSDDPGIPTTQAGGGLRGDESSFWDFLSRDQNLGRGKVSIKKFKLDKDGAGSGAAASDTSAEVAEAVSAAPAPASGQSAVSAAQRQSQSYIPAVHSPSGNVRSIETIDEDVGRKFQFMRVPDSLRSGDATIKVEVRESDF